MNRRLQLAYSARMEAEVEIEGRARLRGQISDGKARQEVRGERGDATRGARRGDIDLARGSSNCAAVASGQDRLTDGREDGGDGDDDDEEDEDDVRYWIGKRAKPICLLSLLRRRAVHLEGNDGAADANCCARQKTASISKANVKLSPLLGSTSEGGKRGIREKLGTAFEKFARRREIWHLRSQSLRSRWRNASSFEYLRLAGEKRGRGKGKLFAL